MKRFVLAAIGLAVAALPVAAEAQQGWRSIDSRQASLYQRLDQGVRSGRLTRPEATRIRAQLRDLGQLERRYRANGLTLRERNDLNRRFDALSARVYRDKHDRNWRG